MTERNTKGIYLRVLPFLCRSFLRFLILFSYIIFHSFILYFSSFGVCSQANDLILFAGQTKKAKLRGTRAKEVRRVSRNEVELRH